MEAQLPENIVLPGGRLNEGLFARREIIYKGMNGQAVERIYASPSISWIYKPLTHDGQWGREAWVYDNVLPALPPIYPKLFVSVSDPDTGTHWMLFEDLGPLHHEFRGDAALELVRHMAAWHSLPADRWPDAPRQGQKPDFGAIVEELIRCREEIRRELSGLAVPRDTLDAVYEALESGGLPSAAEPGQSVLSHGDLHLGNYALLPGGEAGGGRLVVLDWEHAHIGSPLWDLYHLIDMSHPRFPKRMTSAIRDELLQEYWSARRSFGGLDGISAEAFRRQYALFSCAFSVWMLRLIRRDLDGSGGKWSHEQLLAQLEETAENLVQCRSALA